ncbi:MAG: glycosyltransferase family 4 protein [Chitinophagaceae bacterium]
MPKILFSVNNYSSLYNFRNEIIKRYLKEDYTIYLLAPYDSEYVRYYNSIGCTCYSLKMQGKSKNPFKEIGVMHQYYKIYKSIRPSLIYHYTIKPNIYGGIIAYWLKIPFVNFVTGLGTAFIDKGLIYKIVSILYKFVFPKAKRVVVLNKDDFSELSLLIPKIKNNLYLLPSEGIAIEEYIPQDTNIPNITFLMIGRAIRQKGIVEYFEVAKKLKEKYPNSLFAFIGEIGASNTSALTQQELDKWFESKLIDYWGYHKDIQNYIAKASCIVLPSYREGIPISLLEAMAMEKPIITTNAPGCKDVVKDGENGFICEMKSVESLYNAMEKFIQLEYKIKRAMGIYGRKQVEDNYAMDIIWNHYKKIEVEVFAS